MHRRSVRLTRAVRRAACGKESEGKNSQSEDNKRRDESDLFHLGPEKTLKGRKRKSDSRARQGNESSRKRTVRRTRKQTNTSSLLWWNRKKMKVQRGELREWEKRRMNTNKTEWGMKKKTTTVGQRQTENFYFREFSSKEKRRVKRKMEKERTVVTDRWEQRETVKQITRCLICDLLICIVQSKCQQEWQQMNQEKRTEGTL